MGFVEIEVAVKDAFSSAYRVPAVCQHSSSILVHPYPRHLGLLKYTILRAECQGSQSRPTPVITSVTECLEAIIIIIIISFLAPTGDWGIHETLRSTSVSLSRTVGGLLGRVISSSQATLKIEEYVTPKRLLVFNRLQGVISQKTELFTTTGEKTSNPTKY
jgi:hypothetical protein